MSGKSIKLKNDLYWDATGVAVPNPSSGLYDGKTLSDVAPTDTYSSESIHAMTGKAVAAAIAENYPEGTATIASGTVLSANPTITLDPLTGKIVAEYSQDHSVTPEITTPGFITTGKAGTINTNGGAEYPLTTQAAQTITPTTSNQTISAGKYLIGDQTISGSINLIASNIRQGVSIFGVTGVLQGYLNPPRIVPSIGGDSSRTVTIYNDAPVAATAHISTVYKYNDGTTTPWRTGNTTKLIAANSSATVTISVVKMSEGTAVTSCYMTASGCHQSETTSI